MCLAEGGKEVLLECRKECQGREKQGVKVCAEERLKVSCLRNKEAFQQV